MTIWDLLLPWRNIPALKHARKTIKGLKRERDSIARAHSHAHERADTAGKRARRLETELQQTKRTGYADLAKDLGVSVEDIMDGKIEPMLHEDPQAVYRALDNAKASEIKFRLVKRVNLELRLVIRNLIDGLCLTDLTDAARMFLGGAEPYATPLVMGDKRKVLGKRKTLGLNYPKGEDDEAQAQADQDQAATAEGAASTKAKTGDGEAEV